MKLAAAMLLVPFVLGAQVALAQAGTALPVKTISSSSATTGSQFVGPAKVVLNGANPLKYVVKVSVTVSATPGPTPSFVPTGTGAKAEINPADNDIQTKLKQAADNIRLAQANYSALSARIDAVLGSADFSSDTSIKKAITTIADLGTSDYRTAVTTLATTNMTTSMYDVLEGAKTAIGALPAADQQKVALQTLYDDTNAQFTALVPLATRFNAVKAYFDTGDVSIFQQSYADDCSERHGNTTTTTKVLFTLTPVDKNDSTVSSVTDDVSIACESPIALSAGFVFSSLPQRTYSAVTTNTAGVAPPTPAPSATVQESSTSSVRVVPFGFVHARIDSNPSRPLFFTFGVGINSNSGSASTGTTIDYAAGFSYSIAEYVFISIGGHLGQVTTAASGYSPGSRVPVGATIPIQTKSQVAPFLGISFGTH
jgi:hypothetical protein